MMYLVAFLMVAGVTAQKEPAPKEYGEKYIVAVPQCFRPGLPLDVYVDIVQRTGVVTVQVDLFNKTTGEVFSSNSDIVSPGNPQIISLSVPRDLTYKWGVNNSYYVRVKGNSNTLQFENTTTIRFDGQNVTGFLQTDKAVYKPGQTVQYRVFSLYPDLKINKGVYDIVFTDPKGNKIREDEGVFDPTGLIRGSLPLSNEPVYGNWRIQATTAGVVIRKTFEVKEYVLPRIEVVITPPTFVTTSQETVEVTIDAKYTFGEEVHGSLLVTGRLQYWWDRYGNQTEPVIQKRINNFKGSTTITFLTREILELGDNYRWSPFEIEANLTEGLTGSVTSSKGNVRIYENPEKVEFIPSSPNTFKPSLKYTAFVKVTQHDGTPITRPAEKLKVLVQQSYYEPVNQTNATTTTTTPSGVDKLILRPVSPWNYRRYITANVTNLEYDIPEDGFVEIELPFVPPEAESINLIATYKTQTRYWYTNKAYSPSNSFVQILIPKGLQKPGQQQQIQLSSNVAIDSFNLLVSSRGRIVMAREVIQPFPKTKHDISFRITRDMAPRARVLVYYRHPSGEIVPDVVSFNVLDPFENKVSVEFDKTEVEPGENVSMIVRADPNSMVATLVVDKKVLLLKTGNDITEEQVTNSLWRFDSCGYYYYWRRPVFRRKRSFIPWHYPYFGSGRDAASVFSYNKASIAMAKSIVEEYKLLQNKLARKEAGFNILTDSLVYSYIDERRNFVYAKAGVPGLESRNVNTADFGGQVQEVNKLRTKFPETWLFLVEFTDDRGILVLDEVAPDSITSWQATAFAFNDQSGFGITTDPAKLTVVKPFFVNLYLPYSVIRGEDVLVQVNVFNYLNTDQSVLVQLEGSQDFSSLVIDNNGNEQLISTTVQRVINVRSGVPSSVVFPVRMTELGEISLTVRAGSNITADGLTKTVIVKPEGVPNEYNYIELLDLTKVSQYTATRAISYPIGLVEGSQKLGVKLVGDVLGSTVDNLEGLVRMSYGCGEQNMVTFAPTVFVSKYLDTVQQFTPERRQEAINYITSGYQRQMNYKRKDGSYSAFGDRDKEGSLWLTAFVVKCFAAAAEQGFVKAEYLGLKEAYNFIVGRQLEDGSFNSSGVVHHKRMQGQSGKGFSLTAYTLISMLENKNLDSVYLKSREAALNYVEEYISNTTDLYELAIGTYALALAGSPLTDNLLTELETRATNKDGYTYWEVEVEPIYRWEPPARRSQAASIETTSYVCLIYAMKADKMKMSKCLSYLVSQQNDYGGYVSTQDTVWAVQALSAIGPMFYSENPQGTVTVSAAGEAVTFNIDDSNRLDLQRATLPVSADSVTVSGTGTGIFLVSVSAKYNVDDGLVEPAFVVSADLRRDTPTYIELYVCTRYTNGEASGMANVEIRLPSGFTLDSESRDELVQPGLAKRVETFDGKVLLYFDAIDSEDICFTLMATGSGQVNRPKPCPVTVFDYYNPVERALTYYQMTSLNGDWCDRPLCSSTNSCSANCTKRKRK